MSLLVVRDVAEDVISGDLGRGEEAVTEAVWKQARGSLWVQDAEPGQDLHRASEIISAMQRGWQRCGWGAIVQGDKREVLMRFTTGQTREMAGNSQSDYWCVSVYDRPDPLM